MEDLTMTNSNVQSGWRNTRLEPEEVALQKEDRENFTHLLSSIFFQPLLYHIYYLYKKFRM